MMKSSAKTVRKTLSQYVILRAIASSTAIETGQNIQQLERKLAQPSSKFSTLKLAR